VRRGAAHRGHITSMLATSSVTDRPQINSSAMWPMFEVLSTEYQEQTSAIAWDTLLHELHRG
jgi:hypothetical protein